MPSKPRTVEGLARAVAESEVLGHVLIAAMDAFRTEDVPDDDEVARAIAAALRAAGLTDDDLVPADAFEVLVAANSGVPRSEWIPMGDPPGGDDE